MLTMSTFSLLHEKKNFASQLYVHPRAMHIIYAAWIFSAIGFTQSVNMYKTTDTDCLPTWQISARYRYRLSVNHYTRLFKQDWYSHDNNIVTALCCQLCDNLVTTGLYQSRWGNIVTSLIFPSSLLQTVNKLFQLVRTQLVDDEKTHNSLYTVLYTVTYHFFA